MFLPSWYDKVINNIFFSPNDTAGSPAPAPAGGAAPAAPGGTPAAAPAAPTVPKREGGMSGAAERMRARATEIKVPEPQDKKPEETKEKTPEEIEAEKKTAEGGEPEKKEGDKPGDEETKTVLTPEDEAYVESMLEQTSREQRTLKTLQLWASTITPETQTWLRQLLAQRAAKTAQAHAEDAKAAAAAGKPATPADPAAAAAAETASKTMVPITVDKSYIQISDPERQKYEPKALAPDFLRQFGIDPAAVPEPFAKALMAVMKQHNDVVRTLDFIQGDALKTRAKRDELKQTVFAVEFKGELAKAGIDVTPSGLELIPKIRSEIALKNGSQQAWSFVIQEAARKYPEAFPKKPATETGNSPEATKKAQEAIKGKGAVPNPPADPLGTRTTSPPATPPSPPHSYKDDKAPIKSAGARLAERMAKNREKLGL